MRTFLFTFLLFISCHSYSQYIGVKARYTETRLVNNPPLPPSRENRLVLSFYHVSDSGVYTPGPPNFDIAIYKEGLQYGSFTGGVLDSSGNNYPGYPMTAPRAVAYNNSLGRTFIDCDSTLVAIYSTMGQQLDCGFIRVSYWEMNPITGLVSEIFTAPNVCLPYYSGAHPYATAPGNLNFYHPFPPTPPYNKYDFFCPDSIRQGGVLRGILLPDSGSFIGPLPVRFTNVRGHIDAAGKVTVSWSNMTESEISHYIIERSSDGVAFALAGTVLPTLNNGGRADYSFITVQSDGKIWYRIKAIENNGATFYSTIIFLSRSITAADNQSSLSIYPNPVTTGEFTFRLTHAETGQYLYRLIAPGGQPIKQQLVNHDGGDLTRQIDLTGLPPGVYQLVLRSADKTYSQKILYVH